ncbi:MAG: hypothetical protein DCC68_26775 [Planctomycetota bacterium]|nr:MAG: hypothetical protein DCC68_26775 [Planctomycetota bacterium]
MLSIIERDTTNALDAFRVTVGTTAAAIASAFYPCKRGVGLKADVGNSGTIYIGPSDVTAGTTAATDGWPLAAGEELFLPLDDPRAVFAVASAASQQLHVVVV